MRPAFNKNSSPITNPPICARTAPFMDIVVCTHCGANVRAAGANMYRGQWFCMNTHAEERECEDAYIALAFPNAVDCIVMLGAIKERITAPTWLAGVRSVTQICEGKDKERMERMIHLLNLVGGKILADLEADFRLSSPDLLERLKRFQRALGPMAKDARAFRIHTLKDKILSDQNPAWSVARAFVQLKNGLKKSEEPVYDDPSAEKPAGAENEAPPAKRPRPNDTGAPDERRGQVCLPTPRDQHSPPLGKQDPPAIQDAV